MKHLVIACVALLLAACNNKLDLNAPYKELPSIYAVLNPTEDVHIVRVNKVFLGEGDANAMAQVADSVNYGPGEITVTLDRYSYGKQVEASPGKTTVTFTESVIETAAGAFNPAQRIYKSPDVLYSSGDYVLTVKNNHTGNVFTSTTTAFAPISPVIAPMYPPYYPVKPGQFSPKDPAVYIDYSSQASAYKVRYLTNEARLYQMALRVHFYDSVAGSPDKKYHAVDYFFANQDARNVEKAAPFTNMLHVEFTGAEIFHGFGLNLARLNLPDPSTIAGRKTYKIQFFVYSTTQDYIDYLEYVSPSLNISQTKPIYSNFANKAAIGIFTFRTTFTCEKEMSTFFVNEFAYNANTKPYKFYTSDLRIP